MSLDGVTLNSIKYELKQTILDARIDKIYQPEEDELTILLRNSNSNFKLLLSSNSKYPRIHFTSTIKSNPENAPFFCMLLRKHLTGGRIIKFEQPNFERILEIHIEVLDDYRDIVIRKLIIEIMGKHSNIILTDENNIIIDSIKHVNSSMSSVRNVLPKAIYTYPPTQDKINPLTISKEMFVNFAKVAKQTSTITKFIYNSFIGISPLFAEAICDLSGISNTTLIKDLASTDIDKIATNFITMLDNVKNNNYYNTIIYDTENKPIDFYCLPIFKNNSCIKKFDSISDMLDSFYQEKDKLDRLRQKYSDIRKIIENHLERSYKKRILQLKSLEDTKDADTYKLKGDLILSYIYMIKKGDTSVELDNFYSENKEKIIISLAKDLTPSENAQKFYNRYNKMKRTQVATKEHLDEVNAEIKYLETLLASLDFVETENDILEIKEELYEQKYIKRSNEKSKKQVKSEPLHYISSDGFDIFVGKNNTQNDFLTMKYAKSNDLWFHTKEIPGSHVIVRADNRDVPDSTLYEAALLAAYNSKGRNSSNVAVDYTERKNIKKPNGAKPGFVIYLTNKTKYVTPSEAELNKIKKM